MTKKVQKRSIFLIFPTLRFFRGKSKITHFTEKKCVPSAACGQVVSLESHNWEICSKHDSASFLNNGSKTHYFIKIIIFSMVSGKFFDFCQNAHFEVLSQNPQYEPLFYLHFPNLWKSKLGKNGHFFFIFWIST